MYEAVTHEVRVTVEPQYLPERSDPQDRRFFWAYTVEISNLGDEPLQLRSRYWRITDARGRVEEVRGPGVVGEEPTIGPGESYTYSSGCPLTTSSGFMVGHYIMERQSGETVTVKIPAFSLDMPEGRRTVN